MERPGEDSHVKENGMLVVSLRGVNFGNLVSIRVFRAKREILAVKGSSSSPCGSFRVRHHQLSSRHEPHKAAALVLHSALSFQPAGPPLLPTLLFHSPSPCGLGSSHLSFYRLACESRPFFRLWFHQPRSQGVSLLLTPPR